MQRKPDVATWQAQVSDLGMVSPEEEEHILLSPGIYAIERAALSQEEHNA